MTNEQAIERMKHLTFDATIDEQDEEALDMAIEALEVGHAQCNDCHYRYHWMTQRMNGQNGGASA